MKQYDPAKGPDPDEWLAMDEVERILLVERYHRRAHVRLPNHKVHAAIHAVVETQIAEGDEVPAKETLARLMAEGLDRHDAVHAIGSVLAEHMHRIATDPKSAGDVNAHYFGDLKTLTAAKWRK